MTHAFSSLDELGDGPGFRKVRAALGVTAFGINGIVMPPGHDGFLHFHDTQDELYFVHRGRVEVAKASAEDADAGVLDLERDVRVDGIGGPRGAGRRDGWDGIDCAHLSLCLLR